MNTRDHFNRLSKTSNLPGILSALAGMEFYNQIGFSKLKPHCDELLDHAEQIFAQIPEFLEAKNFRLNRPQPPVLRTLKLSEAFAKRAQNAEDLQGVQNCVLIVWLALRFFSRQFALNCKLSRSFVLNTPYTLGCGVFY